MRDSNTTTGELKFNEILNLIKSQNSHLKFNGLEIPICNI
jgi:hypothetical protein